MAADRRLIVVDASLTSRMATELKRRGRHSISAAELGLKLEEDPPLLEALAARYVDELFVLLTGDDAMPLEHADDIARLGITVATVGPHPRGLEGAAVEEWKWETVQRWAHRIETQSGGSVRRYSPAGSGPWTRRRRFS